MLFLYRKVDLTRSLKLLEDWNANPARSKPEDRADALLAFATFSKEDGKLLELQSMDRLFEVPETDSYLFLRDYFPEEEFAKFRASLFARERSGESRFLTLSSRTLQGRFRWISCVMHSELVDGIEQVRCSFRDNTRNTLEERTNQMCLKALEQIWTGGSLESVLREAACGLRELFGARHSFVLRRDRGFAETSLVHANIHSSSPENTFIDCVLAKLGPFMDHADCATSSCCCDIASLGMARFSPSKDVYYVLGLADFDPRLRQTFEKRSEFLKGMIESAALKQAGREERFKEEKDAEIQMLRNHKLAVVGELCANVAHEIKNPLTVLSLESQLLGKHLPDTKDARASMRRLRKGVERMSQIVEGLRRYAQTKGSEKKNCDMNALIQECCDFMRNLLEKEDISIRCEYSGQELPVYCDPGKIQQVFFNLLSNARQALFEKNGAKLIEVFVARDGGEASVLVRDNGPGVAPEVADSIFDRFFSTKDPELGTGIGLSISRKIMREHGGELSLAAGAGLGASFLARLPLSAGPRAEKR